jgi:hypothetical protein
MFLQECGCGSTFHKKHDFSHVLQAFFALARKYKSFGVAGLRTCRFGAGRLPPFFW